MSDSPGVPEKTAKQKRRELQEKQRAEKAARISNTQNKGANKASSSQSNSPNPAQSQLSRSNSAGAPLNRSGSSNRSNPSSLSRASSSNLLHQTPSPNGPVDLSINASRRNLHLRQTSNKRDPIVEAGALFSHLTQFGAKKKPIVGAKIHPDIRALGLLYEEFIIVGGNARCLAMLNVFKKVIRDYVTPPGTSLQRHLTTYLGKQIDHLKSHRALCFSMGFAIRALKYEISILDIDKPDLDAKEQLCQGIDSFILLKIVAADRNIIENTTKACINDGDCILTHGMSSTVLGVLIGAKNHVSNPKKFRVIVCDSRPKLEGKNMVRRLMEAGIQCTYVLPNGLGVVMKEVNKVIIGASAILSNGDVMARSGTSVVAMMAHAKQIPVIVCCETYKFSESIRLDSFVWNELGNPDELLNKTRKNVPSFVSPDEAQEDDVLSNWKEIDNLGLLQLHYDVTPSQFISMVSCDIGIIASTSVLTVMKDIINK